MDAATVRWAVKLKLLTPREGAEYLRPQPPPEPFIRPRTPPPAPSGTRVVTKNRGRPVRVYWPKP